MVANMRCPDIGSIPIGGTKLNTMKTIGNKEITEKAIDSGVTGTDLSIPFVIITIILGGLTLYYFLISRKNN